MADDVSSRIERLRGRIAEMRDYLDVANRENALSELQKKQAVPGFWSNQDSAKAIIDEANRQRDILEPFTKLEKGLQDVQLLFQLAKEETDPLHSEQAMNDAAAEADGLESAFQTIEMRSLLGGKYDSNDAFISLHSGAGGTESCDWVEMLFRMYRRYCEGNNFKIEVLDVQVGEEAGIKSAAFSVSGPNAYGFLKAERGVHRLVRISPFDANKRRHTTFAAADVVAAVNDDVVVEINENDLRIDTYRSSGAGGQHVNKTDSAIRITHLPSGIVVACQAERSQHKNRSTAMKMLRSKVLDWTLDQKRKDMEKFYSKKGEIAWGNQIRSYVLYPYTMVKDHRTDVETSNSDAVLDGDLNRFILAYLKKLRAEQRDGV
ncbi:MAG: peptide chain release factor 2 [bacterium]